MTYEQRCEYSRLISLLYGVDRIKHLIEPINATLNETERLILTDDLRSIENYLLERKNELR